MQVETYRLKNWDAKTTGLLLAENEEWILVHHIPVDYVVDGYHLYRKKFVKSRKTKKQDERIARVLTLKGVENTPPENFEFASVLDTLKACEETYGLFAFQDGDDSEIVVGKYNHSEDDSLIIDFVKASGKIEEEYDFDFSLDEVHAILFETDYLESIVLLMEDEAAESEEME